MAESYAKQIPSEYTDPTAPPPYDTLQPQPQPYPQPQAYPQPYPQPQPYAQPYPQPQPPPQPNVQNTTTYVFTQQPAPTRTVTQVVGVPDNMGLAIFSCLCCFWPLGLAAIVMANQSRDALGRGDVREAQSNSRVSRWLSLLSIGIGVLTIIIAIIIVTTRVRSPTYSRHGYN